MRATIGRSEEELARPEADRSQRPGEVLSSRRAGVLAIMVSNLRR